MVDIRIVEVQIQWRGLAPDREIAANDNCRCIRLEHEPSGVEYSVEIKVINGLGTKDVARLRAEAKLAFIKALHGDA